MKSMLLALMVALSLVACNTSAKSPDVTDSLRRSLDEAGLRDVSVSQDRDKGVVTLRGHVPSEADKAHATQLAKDTAGPQVVANEVVVEPAGAEHEARTVNSDLDSAIGKDLDAALVREHLKDGVKYSVSAGVVTLTGEVVSQAVRTRVEKLASGVPSVTQVIDEIEVKGAKATSTH